MNFHIKEKRVSITMEIKTEKCAVIMKTENKEYKSNKYLHSSSLEIRTTSA
jgi:hypothetical protein